MVKTYVSKPVEIQAIQYTGDNFEEIKKFIINTSDFRPNKYSYLYPDMFINFGEYYVLLMYGDYIFKNNDGRFVKLSKYKFEDIYEVKE